MSKIYQLLIFAFLLRIALSFIVWHPDLNNHVDWGIRFWQYGPEQFYTQNVWSFSWPNQPPGTIIIFAFIRKLYEVVFAFFWWLNVTLPAFPSNIMLFFEERLYQSLLKLPAILADIGIAYLTLRFFKLQKREKIGQWGAVVFLFNPVVLYNSGIWGQTDATVNFFGFLSILLLLERKLIASSLSLLTSLFIKASLLALTPVFLVVAWRQKYPLWTIVGSILLSLAVVGILTVPFSGGKEPFSWLLALYQDKVFGWQLHLITANAFNFWAFVSGIHEQADALMLGPLNFRSWGHLVFAGVLIPLLFKVYKHQDSRTLIWVSMLTFFASFTFLTGMHERYLYPVFPLLTLIVAMERNLLPLFAALSVVHFLNLYNFWWNPRIDLLVELLSAGDRLAPRLLGLLLTIMFILLYVYFFKEKARDGKN